MKAPQISVVTIAYNNRDGFAQTAASVREQRGAIESLDA